MSEQLDRFINLMKGIFEIDKSDLDFGIYRIMNIRKREIETFVYDIPEDKKAQKVYDELNYNAITAYLIREHKDKIV